MNTPPEFWLQVLDRLKSQLTLPAFETWFQSATIQKWDQEGQCLIIEFANPFILNHVQKNYVTLLSNVLVEVLGESPEIRLTAVQGDHVTMIRHNPPKISSKASLSALNSKYTFSRFVVGANNRMAHAASLAVAESPGREFNPLFLCGGVGLGKTHLMQAIAHYRLELFPQAKVFYISTEQFTNDLITAIRQDSMETFRDHYRSVDILLVDDIQFIEGKEYTQEEFFYTFNTLHEAGKQVVIASDRPPKHIPSLQDRLISRFSMGLIADVQVPDLETRMAILQKKAEYENMLLPRSVIEYIASHYTANIRELEGALTRAIAYTSISGLPMTVENLASVLNPPMEQISTSPEIIMQIVADVFEISIEDLKSASRRREISKARQVGMYLMRQHTNLSLPRIGEAFGGKDHTTVMYSCDKVNQKQQKDWEFSQTLSDLSDRINLASRKQN